MTKPYSLDLRERVTERVAAGDSVRAVATIFTVSVASMVRWSQRLRRTGSAAGGKMGGHRACTLIGERGWLMERIAAEPEVTVRGLMTELAERGVAVSYGTVWNFIHREGMSFKKNVLPAEQDRPDVARRRARWKKYQTRIDPARLGRGPTPNRCQPDPPARHDARKTSMGQTESSTLPHIEALRARRTGLIPRETFRCDQARILLLLTDPAARAFDFQSGTDAPDRPQGFSIPCKRTPAPPTRGQAPALRGGPRHRPKIEWR